MVGMWKLVPLSKKNAFILAQLHSYPLAEYVFTREICTDDPKFGFKMANDPFFEKMSNDLLMSCSGKITKLNLRMQKSHLGLGLDLASFPHSQITILSFSRSWSQSRSRSLALALLFLTHRSLCFLTAGGCVWVFAEVGCVGGGKREKKRKEQFPQSWSCQWRRRAEGKKERVFPKLVRRKRSRRGKKEFRWRSCDRIGEEEGKRKKEIKGIFITLLVLDINKWSFDDFSFLNNGPFYSKNRSPSQLFHL